MDFSLEEAIAIGTLINGAIVTYIGYEQYRSSIVQRKLEEAKHIADLFDRRFEVFKSAQSALSKVLTNASCEFEDVYALTESVQQSYFLFDDSIYTYMKEIRSKLINLASARQIRKDPVDEFARIGALAKEHEAVVWLTNELSENGLFLKFKPYLRH